MIKRKISLFWCWQVDKTNKKVSCKTLGSSIVNLGRECKQLVSLENNLKWNFGRYECGHIFCTKHGKVLWMNFEVPMLTTFDLRSFRYWLFDKSSVQQGSSLVGMFELNAPRRYWFQQGVNMSHWSWCHYIVEVLNVHWSSSLSCFNAMTCTQMRLPPSLPVWRLWCRRLHSTCLHTALLLRLCSGSSVRPFRAASRLLHPDHVEVRIFCSGGQQVFLPREIRVPSCAQWNSRAPSWRHAWWRTVGRTRPESPGMNGRDGLKIFKKICGKSYNKASKDPNGRAA